MYVRLGLAHATEANSTESRQQSKPTSRMKDEFDKHYFPFMYLMFTGVYVVSNKIRSCLTC